MSYKNYSLRIWPALALVSAVICWGLWSAVACQAGILQDSTGNPVTDSPAESGTIPDVAPQKNAAPENALPENESQPETTGPDTADSTQNDASQDNANPDSTAQTGDADPDSSSLNPAMDAAPTSEATSQQPTGSDENPINSNAVGQFRDLVAQISKNENEINQLYGTMPLGFPALQGKFMAKIEELKQQNIALKARMREAALASFRAAPNQDVTATQIVFNSVKDKLDGASVTGVFDPQGALETAELMMSSGLDAPQIAYLAFRACYALHDFEQADTLLSGIESTGFKLSPTIRQQLEATKVKFDREQEFRQQETAADDLPRILFETNEGNFVIELFENHAPQTVGNFVSLVEKRFYDDLTFHLVKPGQFAQTGCPIGDGSGDAGYKIPDEIDVPEIRHHFSGTVSMANDGKDTAGSQFFVSHQPNANLDGKFTVFGVVIEGLDTVFKLKKVDKTSFSGGGQEPSKIIRATVLRKRDHEYGPTRIQKQPDFSLDSIPELDSGSRP